MLFDLKELEASTAVVLDQGEESLPVKWMRHGMRTKVRSILRSLVSESATTANYGERSGRRRERKAIDILNGEPRGAKEVQKRKAERRK